MKLSLRVTNLILLITMLSLAGCVLLPKPKFDPNDKTASVVYGYIDIKNMPSELDAVKIQGLGGDDDYVAATVKNGVFYHIAVRPGFRQASQLSGFSSRNIFGHGDKGNVYTLGMKNKNSTAITIKTAGVHFMGSHKYIPQKDKFNLRRIKGPSKKTILKIVLKSMKEDGSDTFYPRQMKMIKKRITQLR